MLIDDAVKQGARVGPACKLVGISRRTLERWKNAVVGSDGRRGPLSRPRNALSEKERERVLDVLNSPEFRDRSPRQIVPELADRGEYLASESTFYRILNGEKLSKHRERSKAPKHKKPAEFIATGPNEVWTWDITYLQSPVRGQFYYLYLFLDIWSRRIAGAGVFKEETSAHAASLFEALAAENGLLRDTLVLHSDNGSPMKGSTLLATLNHLGVQPSFSRPSVSNDNPFSESCFRTLKYRPEYPSKCFSSIADAREWVVSFIRWYNTKHRHSSIAFLTPEERHQGLADVILESRRRLYEAARSRSPERWSRQSRKWELAPAVLLNPRDGKKLVEAC